GGARSARQARDEARLTLQRALVLALQSHDVPASPLSVQHSPSHARTSSNQPSASRSTSSARSRPRSLVDSNANTRPSRTFSPANAVHDERSAGSASAV